MKKVYIYSAYCFKVIDGDTVILNVDLGFNIKRMCSFRLYGIDTPELKSKDKAEKENAQKAKKFLEQKILDKQVVIETFVDKTDKYGRYLCDIIVNDVSINKELIGKGFAKEYFGGKK